MCGTDRPLLIAATRMVWFLLTMGVQDGAVIGASAGLLQLIPRHEMITLPQMQFPSVHRVREWTVPHTSAGWCFGGRRVRAEEVMVVR